MTDATLPMHEIRLVGRGGQGVVTAGELLGRAALREGRFAQAIPAFGPERRGALATCTLRLSAEEILLKFNSTRPDTLAVLDPTIWQAANVLAGFGDGGTLIFNAAAAPTELEAALRSGRYPTRLTAKRCRLFCVDATAIANETIGRPITNTALMGALCGATGLLEMASIEQVLAERFGARAEANIAAARAACDRLQQLSPDEQLAAAPPGG